MFELAAPSPTPAQPFGQIMQVGIPPETPTDRGDTPQPGAFEALLALQTASPIAAIVADPPGTAIRQPGGKTLPKAAVPVAADSIVADELPARTDEQQTLSDPLQTPSGVGLPDPALSDPALIAAIFAAPQRLASSESASEPTGKVPDASATAQAKPLETRAVQPLPLTPANVAAIVIAQATVIKLDPGTPVPAPTPAAAVEAATHAATASQIAARPIAPPRGKPATRETPVERPITLAKADLDLTQPPEAITEPAVALFQGTAPAAPQQDTAPAARAEPRAERIDFATLVETLNRAREEASPNTVRASIHHADFGGVSLRFEQDDRGALSVAMSSADPGFARAVTASSDAAPMQAQADSQRGQNPQSAQSNPGNGSVNDNGGGESPRQQQGQRPGSSPAPQLRDTLRSESRQASPDGLFA